MRACQPKDLKRREWRSTWERGRERGGEREKERTHAGEEEREREHTHAGESERALWLLLLYVFLHLGLPYANWA